MVGTGRRCNGVSRVEVFVSGRHGEGLMADGIVELNYGNDLESLIWSEQLKESECSNWGEELRELW